MSLAFKTVHNGAVSKGCMTSYWWSVKIMALLIYDNQHLFMNTKCDGVMVMHIHSGYYLDCKSTVRTQNYLGYMVWSGGWTVRNKALGSNSKCLGWLIIDFWLWRQRRWFGGRRRRRAHRLSDSTALCRRSELTAHRRRPSEFTALCRPSALATWQPRALISDILLRNLNKFLDRFVISPSSYLFQTVPGQ